jgi:hypothetical protein
MSPWGPVSECGIAKSHWERDPESAVVGWWQECFSRRGFAAQQAACASVRYRGAATTVLATCRAALSELHPATSALLARVEMISNTLSRQ